MDDELKGRLKTFCDDWDTATEDQDEQRFFDCAVALRDYLDGNGFPRPKDDDE